MRKHRYNTVYKIDTCSSLICFFVKRTVFFYIIAHICDVNSKVIESIFFRYSYCIIQVFCIFTIYSNCLQITQINSSGIIFRRQFIRNII